MFLQDWNACINDMPKLTLYCKLKDDFSFENYLIQIKNDSLRKCITRLRSSAHKLEMKIENVNVVLQIC